MHFTSCSVAKFSFENYMDYKSGVFRGGGIFISERLSDDLRASLGKAHA